MESGDRAADLAHDDRTARKARFAHLPAISVGAKATGTQAIGSLALAAVAVGALAIGAVAIGRLVIGRARIRRLEIDELVVRRVRVIEQLEAPPNSEPVPQLAKAVQDDVDFREPVRPCDVRPIRPDQARR